MIDSPSTLVIFIKPKLEILEPLNLLLPVILSSLWGDHIFDYHTAVLVELIAPVTVVSRGECNKVRAAEVRGLSFTFGVGYLGRRHRVFVWEYQKYGGMVLAHLIGDTWLEKKLRNFWEQ